MFIVKDPIDFATSNLVGSGRRLDMSAVSLCHSPFRSCLISSVTLSLSSPPPTLGDAPHSRGTRHEAALSPPSVLCHEHPSFCGFDLDGARILSITFTCPQDLFSRISTETRHPLHQRSAENERVGRGGGAGLSMTNRVIVN
ncbi:hypothetical protein B0H11DRAFT_2280495 [Mycena galericulata]|nr:hypothetical protein B0H11DRAFT_2280495 [Mycena galericulata]